MYKKLALMWLGYKTPLKLVLCFVLQAYAIQAAILFKEDRMKVKDYEVLEGIMEEHTMSI